MKKQYPDDYFNNGIIEMARFGNVVQTINHMNEDQHNQMIKYWASKYNETKEKIDNIISEIKGRTDKADPLELLNFLVSMNQLIMMNKMSESDFSSDEDMQLRCVEYIQGVLVSSNAQKHYDQTKDEVNQNYFEILDLVSKLYTALPSFYLAWISKEENNKTKNQDEQTYIMLSQLMFQVRGIQYQDFRIPILEKLLMPHNEEINKAYGITAGEVIKGLRILEYNLSSGRLDALKSMVRHMNKLRQEDFDGLSEDYFQQGRTFIMQAVGVDLFDIKKHTAWPDKLIDNLSYGVGEYEKFFNQGEFSGWPISDNPVARRPFIKIDGKSYCFDYYVLFDNFYKAFRKSIVSNDKKAIDEWSKIQGCACEEIVAGVFSALLPGCITNISNYYPINKKNNAENDVIVRYKDVLFIVEVKAGAFTYTSAMLDLDGHKASLNALVENPEKQCLRTKKYIESGEKVLFYKNADLKEKTFEISAANYSQIYMFDVTIADFNAIAAQMEKMKIANTKEDIITISLNDLWVYKEYFDSPLEFIHFVNLRTRATRVVNLNIMDELDHLGLYIHENMYSLLVESLDKNTQAFFNGYREDIDYYFAKKHMGIAAEKPRQKYPDSIKRILKLCQEKDTGYVTKFTNFILDFAGDMRDKFDSDISELAKRERELKRMISGICFGEISYALMIKQLGIENWNKEQQKEYVLATLAKNNNPYCYAIEISLDSNDKVEDIEFKYFSQEDIPKEQRETLEKRGEQLAKQRMRSILLNTHQKKIYPNDLCPCGSGKKYKKCCGR